MLPNTLITNEIKDRAGAEVEFQRISIGTNSTVFAQVGELPAYPRRLTVRHEEIGNGVELRRRSNIKFDYTVAGGIDTTKTAKITCSTTLDYPKGNLANANYPKDVVAHMMSFLSSLGASTTILYDCTGYGASTLIDGSI